MLARDSVENNAYFRDTVRIEIVGSNGEVLAEWNRSVNGLRARPLMKAGMPLNLGPRYR